MSNRMDDINSNFNELINFNEQAFNEVLHFVFVIAYITLINPKWLFHISLINDVELIFSEIWI